MDLDFSASLDTKSKLLTGISVLLLLFLLAEGIFQIHFPADMALVPLLIAGLLAFTFIIVYAFCVGIYTISFSGLIIRRKLNLVSFSIPYDQIQTVRSVSSAERRGLLRLFGNGGLLGYTGRFYNKQMGSIKMCATNMNNLVLITLKDGKKIGVTPDDPSFVEELQKRIN